jgi:hypothetical protein
MFSHRRNDTLDDTRNDKLDDTLDDTRNHAA